MREAQRWASAIQSTSETLVVLGIGLGYHLLSLRASESARTLVAVDGDLALFGLAVRLLDLSDVIMDPNVHLLVGKEAQEAGCLLGDHAGSTVSYREYFPATRFHPNYYRIIRDGLEDLMYRCRLSETPDLSRGVVRLIEETKA